MGGSAWSDDAYNDRKKVRAAAHTPVFAHDAAVRAGTAASALHTTLDPSGVKLRESRDSAAHPNSKAVAVFLDVTGSMAQVPKMIQAKLPSLMGLLIRKSYLADPHIMVGAIGDANSDKVPLQVGQFEAGIEIDNDISNIYMEGNGGGQNKESYELAMYFMARHTSIDCFEKRGEKGYLFILGDELFYPKIETKHVRKVFGEELSEPIATKQIVGELLQKYEVFFIIPNLTNHYDDEEIYMGWVKLLGERVLKLDDPNGVCELIASTIAVLEGTRDADSVVKDLKDAGTSKATVTAVSKALIPIYQRAGEKPTNLSVPSSGSPTGLTSV